MDEFEINYGVGNLYMVQFDAPTSELTPNTIQLDRAKTVEFFKTRLENLIQADKQIRKKIKQMHKLHHQLSLLINKFLNAKYGTIQTDQIPIQKPLIPPLPPIEQGSLSELLRILHSQTPTEIQMYLSKSLIVEQLIFEDSSIFNDVLLESLMRTPPDIQISFIEGILNRIRQCRQWFFTIIPLLSQYSMEGCLRSQLLSSTAKQNSFFAFYSSVLNNLAEICKSDECKIIYSTNESKKLIYPTETFSHIIYLEDSLTGKLMKECKPQTVESPFQDQSFEVGSEGAVFEKNEPILSIPIFISQCAVTGLVIFFRQSPHKFSHIDEIMASKTIQYLTPILTLFRRIFIRMTPRNYSQLFQSISSLRINQDNLFHSIKTYCCSLTSATFCKLYLTDSEKEFADVKQLPLAQSLTRSCFKSGTLISYKNPRNLPDFNREVDDEITLSKISSMLIVPVKNSPLIIVLYNPSTSSEFLSIHKSMVNLFSVSLPPLLSQFSMKNQLSQVKRNQEMKMESLQKVLHSLNPLIAAINDSSFFKSIQSLLPDDVHITLFYFINSHQVYKLPENEIIEPTTILIEIEEVTLLKSDEEPSKWEIEDKNVQSLLGVPSCSENKSICFFSSSNLNAFDNNLNLYEKYARNILLLLPSYLYRNQLNELVKRHQLIDDVSHLSLSAISKFVGTDIDCQYFSPPMSQDPKMDKPLAIMVETPKGIEAVLTSDIPIRTSTTKNTFVTFAKYMSAVLANRAPLTEPEAICTSFFIDNNIMEVFNCTIFNFTEWITYIFSMYKSNEIDPFNRFEESRFVRKLFDSDRWANWFTKEEIVVIILIVFLKEIPKCWRCKVDNELISLFDQLKCKPESGLFISILFGKKFGVAGEQIPIYKKKLLIETVNNYVIGSTSADFSAVSAHIRLLAMQSFKRTIVNKLWLGRALILISEVKDFAEINKPGRGDKLIEMKQKIVKIERIFVPMITYLSVKNDNIQQILNDIHEKLNELHIK